MRLKISLYVTVTVLILCGVLFLNNKPKDLKVPSLQEGVIDTTAIDITDGKIIPLNGEWEFYPNVLLSPDEINEDVAYITLPTDLTDIDPSYENSFGTVRGTIAIDDINKIYALKIKYFSTAYKLFIDGSEVAEVGKVGKTKNEYKSYLYSEDFSIFPKGNEIEIVLQYANFHHKRVQLSTIYFGDVNDIKQMTTLGIIKDSILFGILFLLGIFQLLFFVVTRKNKSVLFLGWIGLLLSLRIGIVNERILVRLIPDITGEILMKMGFLPTYLITPLVLLYVLSIFKVKPPKWVNIVVKGYIIIISLIVGLTTVKVYDQLFVYVAGIIISLTLAVLIKTFRDMKVNKIKLNLMIISISVLLVTGINDYVREFYNGEMMELLSYGFVFFVTIQAFFIAWSANINFRKTEQLVVENGAMLNEISVLNDQLEERIKERTALLEDANRELERLTYIDPLIGINNRRSFDEKIKNLWEIGEKALKPIGIMIIDIDDFKHYNDYFGHLQGDECLREIGQQILAYGNASDGFACRYGGEEFILLYDDVDEKQLKTHIQSLCKQIEKIGMKSTPYSTFEMVTISIGGNSIIPNKHETLEVFIKRADEALYEAKGRGKNQGLVSHI